jgi:hypothetical protein
MIDGYSCEPDMLEEIAPPDPRHDQAAELARAGATLDDIAEHFGCSPLMAWWLTGYAKVAERVAVAA